MAFFGSSPSSPGNTFVAAPDLTLTPVSFRGIYIGGTGDLVITDAQNNTVTFAGLAAGVIHPISGKEVQAASTTTGMVLVIL